VPKEVYSVYNYSQVYSNIYERAEM